MIEVKELHKTYGHIKAVDGVSFSAAQGDVLGFLGPNGAGKSTTMKMIACFINADKGTASVNGYDINNQPLEVKRNLGYLPENSPLYEEMTVEALLKFVCDARGITGSRRKQSIEKVASECAIENVMHQLGGTLSKGYCRRVGLAQALIHNPSTLILDEPTDGLDPNQKHQVRELIKELSSEKCIVISTHILEEVEAICNRIVIIDEGRMLVDSTPAELKSSEGGSLDEIFRKLTSKKQVKAG